MDSPVEKITIVPSRKKNAKEPKEPKAPPKEKAPPKKTPKKAVAPAPIEASDDSECDDDIGGDVVIEEQPVINKVKPKVRKDTPIPQHKVVIDNDEDEEVKLLRRELLKKKLMLEMKELDKEVPEAKPANQKKKCSTKSSPKNGKDKEKVVVKKPKPVKRASTAFIEPTPVEPTINPLDFFA